MPLAASYDMTEEQKTLLEFITKRFMASDKLHKDLDPKLNVWYGLSRNYRRLANRHAQASTPNDKDTTMQMFKREFGDDLFIPYIYTVIETVLPGILSTDPTISAKPNKADDETQQACEPVKRLFERDQKRMEYEMRLQETVRSGLRYGLGVQKLFWEKKFRSGKEIQPMQTGPGYKVEQNNHICVYEGPKVESVDIFDFFWDPIAYNLDSCSYVIHRTWRTMEYIKDRVKEGEEARSQDKPGGWAELDLEKVKGLCTTKGRGEVWSERYEAAGLSSYEVEGEELYEVWEYHDRENVYTVLGRELIVQEAENPFFHGDFPFQIFRPVVVEHEFLGIGETEPIAHLNAELNMMRGQRRDAANYAMARSYFYSRGMVKPHELVMGIGVFNPVDGDPNEVIKEMPFRDLPASGVSEEQALKADIELATGLSESVLGSGGEETATGTQLVQAAAGKRIRMKCKNLHVELLRPTTRQMRELYRQHVTEESQSQPIRVEPTSNEPDNVTPTGYSFVVCGPAQLNADIEVEPIDGSTEAENDAQKKADAVQLVDALTPFAEQLEPREMAKFALRKFGVTDPEHLLKPPGPPPEQGVVEDIAGAMKQAGIPEEEIHLILESAVQGREEAQEPPKPGAPSSNGSAPPEPVAPGG